MVVTGIGNNEEKLDYPRHIYGGIAEGQYHHEIPKKSCNSAIMVLYFVPQKYKGVHPDAVHSVYCDFAYVSPTVDMSLPLFIRQLNQHAISWNTS